jgi:hypothetical protein
LNCQINHYTLIKEFVKFINNQNASPNEESSPLIGEAVSMGVALKMFMI